MSRYGTRVLICDTKGNGRKWARAIGSRRGGPASASRRQAEKPEGNSGNRGKGAGVEPGWTAVRGTRQPAARARTMATSGLRVRRLTLSVVLFTSRTMVAGVGMRYDGTPFVSLHREGRGIYRGGGQRERVGSVDDTVRALLLPAPARRALRTAGLSHSRSLSQPKSLIERDREPVGHRSLRKTQGPQHRHVPPPASAFPRGRDDSG